MKASVFFFTKIWKTFLSLSYAMRIFSLFLSVFSSFFFLLLHLIRQISLGNLFFPIESLCQQHARTITRNQKKLIIIIIIKNWREEKKSGGVLLFSFPPLYFSLWNISSWSLAMIKEIFNVLNGGGGDRSFIVTKRSFENIRSHIHQRVITWSYKTWHCEPKKEKQTRASYVISS